MIKNFILPLFIGATLAYSAPVKKVEPTPKTVVVQVIPGSKIRSPEDDAKLKDWITGILKEAQLAEEKASEAEKEAANSRAHLGTAIASLKEAMQNSFDLQKAIDAQTKSLNQAIVEKEKAQAHDAKTTKQNNLLKNILGLEAAVIAVLACLYFKVPSLSYPWGIVATIGAAPGAFFLIKLLL